LGFVLLLVAAAPGVATPQGSDGRGSEKGPQKRVLILHPESRLLPATARLDETFRTKLRASWPGEVDFHVEQLDLSLFDEDAPPREIRALLRRKYARRRLDLIVPMDSRTLRIAVANRTALFSGAPIVFTTVDRAAAADIPLDQNVTGTWLVPGWAGTLDAALGLQPRIRRAVVIGGTASVDRVWLASARRQLALHQGRVEITYLTDLSLSDVLTKVAALPPDSVVLIGAFLRDAAGQSFTTREVVARITAVSSAPVYGLGETLLGEGIVGGQVVSYEAHGRVAAEFALRVLRGERPPPTDAGTTVPMFDWRELQRWGLDERRLPSGSVVLYRRLSTWERYRWWIVGAATLLLLQSALIAVLLVQRASRRRARRALAERLRFETLLSDLSAGFAAGDPTTADRDIERGLRRVVEALDVDRVTLTTLTPSSDEVRVTHSWTREGVTPLRNMVRGNHAPWILSRLRQGLIVRLGRSGDLPVEATVDRRTVERFGTRSAVVIPLVVGGSTVGSLAIASLREDRSWPDELVARLRLLADVFTNALAQQRSDQAVRESEERFRRMADSAPVMVWMSGSDGRRTYVNQRWLEFTGRPADQEMGEGWAASVHLEDQADLAKALSTALAEGRPFTVEYRLHRRDGQARWVLDHGVPRRADDGSLLGYVGSAVDVTQLRAAQRALLETDLLRSAIFGALYGHVAALDKNGRIIAVNQAWLRFAGENGGDTRHVSVGANYLDVCREASDAGDPNARRVLEVLRTVLAGGRPVQIEYASRTPAGERWFEMTAEPLRRSEGGVLVTHVDVTRRRQAEEEAQRQRDELAHVLRTTTLGELAGSLAHEINQPLAAIVANAQATRRLLDAGRGSRPGVVDALADIVADARRASEVIRRLRALFRKEHVEWRPVDVNELVGDVVSLLRHDVERRRVALHSVLGGGLAPVPGDSVQLQQVLLNLLVNASEAIAGTEDGPREITIETARRDSGGVAISIQDTGPGVKEPDLEHIFEPFVSAKPGGLGMGLAISRSIVEAHGGRIWATANPDRGLTVHVDLPAEPTTRPG
jgi:hypothetical protein